jgi:hypothetical protein
VKSLTASAAKALKTLRSLYFDLREQSCQRERHTEKESRDILQTAGFLPNANKALIDGAFSMWYNLHIK